MTSASSPSLGSQRSYWYENPSRHAATRKQSCRPTIQLGVERPAKLGFRQLGVSLQGWRRTGNDKNNSRFLRCAAHGEAVSSFGRNDGLSGGVGLCLSGNFALVAALIHA